MITVEHIVHVIIMVHSLYIADPQIIPYTSVHVPVKVWYESSSVLFYQSKVISLQWPRYIPCFKHFSGYLFIHRVTKRAHPTVPKPADLTAQREGQRLEFLRYLN